VGVSVIALPLDVVALMAWWHCRGRLGSPTRAAIGYVAAAVLASLGVGPIGSGIRQKRRRVQTRRGACRWLQSRACTLSATAATTSAAWLSAHAPARGPRPLTATTRPADVTTRHDATASTVAPGCVATSVATSTSSDASISSTRPYDLDAPARSGRIYALPHQVEGLVRDNRMEVRVLFGASSEGPAWRGFCRSRPTARDALSAPRRMRAVQPGRRSSPVSGRRSRARRTTRTVLGSGVAPRRHIASVARSGSEASAAKR
jgi:hypothetical protein